MNIDILYIISYITYSILASFFLRGFFGTFLPQEFRDLFDTRIYVFRNNMIKSVEAYFTGLRNFEVVMFTRVLFPFFMMYTINEYLSFILRHYIYPYFVLFSLFVWFFKIFFFLNIAPSLDDIQFLYQSTTWSRLFVLIKFGVLLYFSPYLTDFWFVFLFIAPLSFIFSIENLNYVRTIELESNSSNGRMS